MNDILDRILKRVPTILCTFYGDPHWRFHILLSNEKNQEIYIGLKFAFFFNSFGWRYSAMKNFQYSVPFSPQELYLEVCLSAN